MVEGTPLRLTETAHVAPLEDTVTIPTDPLPTQDEFVMHDAIAAMLQAVADKFGVQVSTIEVKWIDDSTMSQPHGRVRNIQFHTSKQL
jgi:hypothetical protein